MADQFDPTQFGAVAVEEPPPFDPTQHGAIPVQPTEEPSILQKTGRAVVDTLKGFLPQSVSDVALAPINMIPGFGQAVKPLENIAFGRPISEGVSPLQGIPVVQRIPQIIQAEKTPAGSQERFTTGAGVVADLAMLAGFKSALHPELAEVAGIAKPDIAQPSEPVSTGTAAATPIVPEAAQPVVAPEVAPSVPAAESVVTAPLSPETASLGKVEPVAPDLPTGTGEVKPEIPSDYTTQQTTTNFNVGRQPNTFEIKTKSGASVNGYLKDQDFPNEGPHPKRGEIFLTSVPESERGQGTGYTLTTDAIKLLKKNGAETVNLSPTSAGGKRIVEKLQDEGLIHGPIKTSPTGKAEYSLEPFDMGSAAKANKAQFNKAIEATGTDETASIEMQSPTHPNLRVLITPDAAEPGKWRATRVDSRGPAGHNVYDSREKAISDYTGGSEQSHPAFGHDFTVKEVRPTTSPVSGAPVSTTATPLNQTERSISGNKTPVAQTTEAGTGGGWYHGSHEQLNEFAPREVKDVDSLGTWVTSSPEHAKKLYGPNVKQAELSPDLNLLEFDGNDRSTRDFHRILGGNAELAEKAGFRKEAAILRKTLPDTLRLGELMKRFERSDIPETSAQRAERQQLSKAEKASETLLRSPKYNQLFRQMLRDQGYDGIVWKNSRIDQPWADTPHDVAVIFHEKPIKTTPENAPSTVSGGKVGLSKTASTVQPETTNPQPQETEITQPSSVSVEGQALTASVKPETEPAAQEQVAPKEEAPTAPKEEQPNTIPTPAETQALSGGEDSVGIAERYREEQQPGSVIPGVGKTADEARAWGHDFINKGGNPYDVINNKGTKRELWQDVGVVRAEYERLSNEKRAAEAALEANPSDPQLKMAFGNAEEAQRQWSKDAQPVLTRAGDALRAASRSYPREINTFSDFTDIINDHFKGEVELTPEKRAELQKAVKAIKKGNVEATEARAKVTDEAVKKANGKVMDFDTLKTDLNAQMTKLMEDCVL